MEQEIKHQCLKCKRRPAFKLLLPRKKSPLVTHTSFNSFLPVLHENYKEHDINLFLPRDTTRDIKYPKKTLLLRICLA